MRVRAHWAPRLAQTAHRTKGPALLAADLAILPPIGPLITPLALRQVQVALQLQFLAQDIVLGFHVLQERLNPALQPHTLIEELNA